MVWRIKVTDYYNAIIPLNDASYIFHIRLIIIYTLICPDQFYLIDKGH